MDEGPSIVRAEFGGDDADQARAMYEGDYRGSGFLVEPARRDFSYRYTITGDSTMSLRSSMFMARIQGVIQPESEYVASWITAGSGVMDIGGDETPMTLGRPAMFPSGKPFAFDFAGVRQNLVHLDAALVEGIAAEREGVPRAPIRFFHAATPSPTQLARWKSVVDETAGLLLGGRPTPLQLAELQRRTATVLLDTFAHEVDAASDELLHPRNARLREAVEYLHSHPHLPTTPAALAARVGLSPRGLQQAFQRKLGMTPTAYLRHIRLDRVRAELQQLAPRTATVSGVAARWGFTHLGRFSIAYAERFGEHPSTTLRR